MAQLFDYGHNPHHQFLHHQDPQDRQTTEMLMDRSPNSSNASDSSPMETIALASSSRPNNGEIEYITLSSDDEDAEPEIIEVTHKEIKPQLLLNMLTAPSEVEVPEMSTTPQPSPSVIIFEADSNPPEEPIRESVSSMSQSSQEPEPTSETVHMEVSEQVQMVETEKPPSRKTSKSPTALAVQAPSKPAAVPVRKSRRINKEEARSDNELISNFHNGMGVLDRGTTIPVGLRRQPFYFKDISADEKAERVKDQLKIDMRPSFMKAGAVSQGFPSDKPSTSLKRSRQDSSEPSTSSEKRMKICARPMIRVGDNFQAVLNEELLTSDSKLEEDREECMWVPPEEPINYETLRNEYWRAIWRQYENQIPFENALENLMNNGYSFEKSLDSIDQHLKKLPQVFKPLCMAQIKQFYMMVPTIPRKKRDRDQDRQKKHSRRILQERAMRNYHIGEVQRFLYIFRKFFKYQAHEGLICNCLEPLCAIIEFEPRWGCSNCTKALRTTQDSNTPSTSSSVDKDKLCLICKTYMELSGGAMRPAEDVVFNEDDLLKIQQWNQMETSEGKTIPREEFEQKLSQLQTERWIKNEVTPEENSMLNFNDLRIPNRKNRNFLNEEEKEARGMKIAAQLQPYIMPLFSRCQCTTLGYIPRGSPNEYKYDFDASEQEVMMKALREAEGDSQKAADILKVERQFMERFMCKYGFDQGIPSVTPVNTLIKKIRYVPPLYLPPVIPNLPPSNNSSREGSPYIPPEKKAPKRKRPS